MVVVGLAGALLVSGTLNTPPASAVVLNQWFGLPGLDENGMGGASDPSWVRVFAYGSTPNVVYAGTEGAGVWVSTNAGIGLWTQMSDGLPSADSVYQFFTAGSNLFAVTSGGLFSIASGSTSGSWSAVADGPQTDPATQLDGIGAESEVSVTHGPILLGTFSEGVYSSSDGGMTWTPPAADSGLPEGTTVWGMASLGPAVWAATSEGVYRSLDAGVHWSPSGDGIPFGDTLSIFQDSNDLIYYVGTASDGLYRSVDGGTTWQSIDADGTAEPFGGSSTPTIEPGQFAEYSVPPVGSTPGQTKVYVPTSDGVWVVTLSNYTPPGPVSPSYSGFSTPVWRQVTNTGFPNNSAAPVWGLSTISPTDALLAGTQSNGGYELVFQPPSNAGGADLPTTGASAAPVAGQTLDAQPGTWTGTQQIDYTYQWQRCTSTQTSSCTNIAAPQDASEQDYTVQDMPGSSDVGDYLRVVVTATNDFPSIPKAPYTATSAMTQKVLAPPQPLPGSWQESGPEIVFTPAGDGEPTQGDTFSAPPESASDPAGWFFNPAQTGAVIYQWLRCDNSGDLGSCVPIAGATSANYVASAADVNQTLAVQITGKSSQGSEAVLPLAASTDPIISLPASDTDPATATTPAGSPPKITGDPYVGSELDGSVGTWSAATDVWQRQWMQCQPDGSDCSPIQDATGASYSPTDDDLGMTIELEVTADVNDDVNHTMLPDAVVVDSALTAIITDPPPPASTGGVTGGSPGSGSGGSGSPSGGDSGSPSGGGSGSPSGGGAGARSTGTSDTPIPGPVIASRLALSDRGKRFAFSLSAPAALVTVQIERRELRSCGRRGHPQRCTTWVALLHAARRNLPAGGGSIQLPAKLNGHRFPTGIYRIVVVTKTIAGVASQPVWLTVSHV